MVQNVRWILSVFAQARRAVPTKGGFFPAFHERGKRHEKMSRLIFHDLLLPESYDVNKKEWKTSDDKVRGWIYTDA